MSTATRKLREQCIELLETRGGVFAPSELATFAAYAAAVAGTEPVDEVDRQIRAIARKVRDIAPRPLEHAPTPTWDAEIVEAEAALAVATAAVDAALAERERVRREGQTAVREAGEGETHPAAREHALAAAAERARAALGEADSRYKIADQQWALVRARLTALELGRDRERARLRYAAHAVAEPGKRVARRAAAGWLNT